MATPRIEDSRPNQNEGLDSLSGGRSVSETIFSKPVDAKDVRLLTSKDEETPEQKAIRERRFTAQPHAGEPLWKLDPVPGVATTKKVGKNPQIQSGLYANMPVDREITPAEAE
jgi:hypothetical protein